MITLSQSLLKAALAELKVAESVALVRSPSATKTYAAYLAAFGPSLRQLGLLPVLAIYRKSSSDGDEPKKELYDYLCRLLLNPNTDLLDQESRKKLESTGDLFTYFSLPDTSVTQLRPRLEKAVIAAKLALRTYPMPTSSTILTEEE